MKILDLFAGIGVASLAAETVWPGIEHEFVEINPYSQTILKKHFPNSPIHADIRTYHPTGAVDIVWGSPPCQAASQAGQRKGTADARWLWPDTFRVIREAKPRWYILENVYGLLSLEDGVEFEALCAEMDKLGYEVRTFVVPALAVGAPHERNRVWIIGYRDPDSFGCSSPPKIVTNQSGESSFDDAKGRRGLIADTDHGRPVEQEQQTTGNQQCDRNATDTRCECGEQGINNKPGQTQAEWTPQTDKNKRCYPIATDAKIKHEEWSVTGGGGQRESKKKAGNGNSRGWATDWEEDWRTVAARTCVRSMDDGAAKRLFRLANGTTISAARNRTEALKALGNSLVYPLVVKILEAIKYADVL